MNFDPFDFYGNGNEFFDDYYSGDFGGYNDIGSGIMTSIYWIAGLIVAAIIIGIIVNATFLKRKNEGRFKGTWGKLYNMLSFNRFYSEGITKLLGVITFFILTFLGIYMICTGSVISGILTIVLGNLGARLCYEMIMMFIILCKKSVTLDKRLSNIEKFYDDTSAWDVEDKKADGLDEMEEPTGADEEEFVETSVEPEAFEEAAPADNEPIEEAPVTEEVSEEAPVEAEPLEEEPKADPEFEKRLRDTLGDPDAPKYGYDEECRSCENWDEVSEDCYCEDDCLTCDKPDQDKAE